MAVNEQHGVHRDFICGRLAFWAGDFDVAEDRLRHVTDALRQPWLFPDNPSGAVVIREAALSYLNAISGGDRRSRFRPVETANLRGSVRRTGLVTFEMRAYLRNLEWEATLQKNFIMFMHPQKHQSNPAASETDLWLARSSSPLVAVHAGSLGLVTALGAWCSLPQEEEEIWKVFQGVLERLEAGE